MEPIWSLVVAACSVVLGTGLGWWVSTKNAEKQWRREDERRRYDRTDAAVQELFLASQVLMRSIEDADAPEDLVARLIEGGTFDRFHQAQQMVIARGSASHPGLVNAIKPLVDLVGKNPATLHKHAMAINFLAGGWLGDDQEFEGRPWPGWKTLGVVEKLRTEDADVTLPHHE